MLVSLKQFVVRFHKEEGGSIAVESILIFRLLTWAYLATFVYFDAFRQQAIALKSNYTISDMLSRETGYVTPQYLASVYRLQQFLTTSNKATGLRGSVITYRASDTKYLVRWSQGQGGAASLTNADIPSIQSQIPIMPDGEIVILVENWVVYEPAFSIGLDAFTFQNLIVTRPRFAGQLCWNSVNNGDNSSATC